ncbi:MAG: hypothetical protein OXK73_06635 [Rhodospirillaceae bacterium]|nr:hypothetical protein [Rhodospirillaceae bacterium]
MPKPNKFESKLFAVAKRAQKFHTDMTGLWYPLHTHESFFQNYIAMKVYESLKFQVYVDATPTKLEADSNVEVVYGEDNANKRFDLAFWRKSDINPRVKSILEIKHRGSTTKVREDCRKIKEFLEYNEGVSGYALYYTQPAKVTTADSRFSQISEEPRVSMIKSYINRSEPIWGVALYRCYPS